MLAPWHEHDTAPLVRQAIARERGALLTLERVLHQGCIPSLLPWWNLPWPGTTSEVLCDSLRQCDACVPGPHYPIVKPSVKSSEVSTALPHLPDPPPRAALF